MKWMSAVVTVALVALAVLVLVWAGQRHLVYFPDRDVVSPASAGLPDGRNVTIPAEDGTILGGWFVTSPQASVTFLIFNGNAGNRGYRAPLAAALRDRGFNVLLFDYHGYGDSTGTPSEAGLSVDARAARGHLLRTPGVDPSKIVYFGESLGAAVATSLAAISPPAALILRSPFTSLADVGRHHYPILPVRMLLRDRFDSIGTIRRVHVPVLVVAGERDGIIPIGQSRRLFEQVPDARKKLLVLPADHNDADLLYGREMLNAIVEFVGQIAGNDAPR